MNCNGKCGGRMKDCCSEGEGAKSGAGGVDMDSHEIGHRKNAAKPEWVQAVAVGIIVLFMLGILLRGM